MDTQSTQNSTLKGKKLILLKEQKETMLFLLSLSMPLPIQSFWGKPARATFIVLGSRGQTHQQLNPT